MNEDMGLIELQAYVLTKGESLTNQPGKYKSTPEALKILHKVWKGIEDEEEKEYFEKMVVGTPYEY